MPNRPDKLKPRIRVEVKRPSSAKRGYGRAHQIWREVVLRRAAYICAMCHKPAGHSAHADHIIPITERPDLQYAGANGQCLCHACHNAKTAKERI